jgi:hypothetical protein
LDIDALAALGGSRDSDLIAEYQYTLPDGTKVEQTESSRIRVLSRNEVIYSNRTATEMRDWYDTHEFAPILITAFCDSNDPVIQQLAGRISGMANGPAASINAEDSINYLVATWKFLSDNRIVYQPSPSLINNGTFDSDIKYGRDVLKSRSGNCLDLSLLIAAAAKAVGLKAHIVMMPGNAIVMVELPNGEKLPFETKLLGKGTIQEAVAEGQKQLELAVNGPHLIIDVQSMENQGVRALELEPVGDDFFTNLKYVFNPLETTK